MLKKGKGYMTVNLVYRESQMGIENGERGKVKIVTATEAKAGSRNTERRVETACDDTWSRGEQRNQILPVPRSEIGG